MTSSGTVTLLPAPLDLTTPPLTHCPALGTILRRLAANLAVACFVPGLLFYATLVTLDVRAAVIVALTWTYGAIAWRRATRRPVSGLLVLTVAVLTVRTVITLSTGNTFVYFFQPVVSDGLVAVIFLVSLLTARPVVARLAADFYPMTHDVAARPRIRRLFWHLTLLWALVSLVKGTVGLWLLTSQSLVDFVLFKNLLVLSLTVVAVTVTVTASTYVARKEGLITRPGAPAVG